MISRKMVLMRKKVYVYLYHFKLKQIMCLMILVYLNPFSQQKKSKY